MQNLKIETNPYEAKVSIRVRDDAGSQWYLPPNSDFERFEGKECVFAYCVEDILQIVKQYWMGISTIYFVGTFKDFSLLKVKLSALNLTSIEAIHEKMYLSADDAIEKIRSAYKKINSEFATCSNDNIIKIINQFEDTVSTKIPLCVIGTYSAGKSTFINALIGREILPSAYDPSTAINVEVLNVEDVFSIELYFENKKTIIDFIEKTVSPYSLKLEAILIEHGFGYDDPSVGIYRFLEFINSKESKCLFGEEGLDFLVLRIPFKNSNLDTSNDIYYSIYDTPGSNNAITEAHRKCLADVLREQTNALPIVITNKEQQASNDINSLLDLLTNHHEDFSIPNTLIVMSKADTMTPSQIMTGISEVFKNKFFNPLVYYVSALQCLAEKKDDVSADGWMEPIAYENYSKHIADSKQRTNCHEYNNGNIVTSNYSQALVESGMLDVEYAINSFAQYYANYKKCVNGRQFLLEAIRQITIILNLQKEELVKLHAKKKAEQQAKRKQIFTQLSAEKLPDVMGRIQRTIIKTYTPHKKAYAASIRATLDSLLIKNEGVKQLSAVIKQSMEQDCQSKLYDSTHSSIRSSVEQLLNTGLQDYQSRILRIIAGHEDTISEEASLAITDIISNGQTPKFTSKKANFAGVGFFVAIGSLKIKALRESWLDGETKKFSKHVCGDGKNKMGAFSWDCIHIPLEQYYKELVSWQTRHLKDIDQTLTQENAILTQYEKEIVALEAQIQDLECRLQNIQDSKELLSSVLSKREV